MKTSSLPQVGAAAILATAINTAQAGPSPVAVEIDLTNKAVLAELCKSTNNNTGVNIDNKDICEISTDGGKTWMLYAAGGGLVALGTGGYLLRRRRNKAKSGEEAESDTETNSTTIPGVPSGEADDGSTTVLVEEVDKSPLEITDDLIVGISADPRATLADGSLSKIKIGSTEYDMTDWVASSDTPGVWEKGDAQIIISPTGKISHIADKNDLDKNITETYPNGTTTVFDSSGLETITLMNGNTIVGLLDEIGNPTAGTLELDSSGNTVSHYDATSTRISGAPSQDGSAELDAILGAVRPNVVADVSTPDPVDTTGNTATGTSAIIPPGVVTTQATQEPAETQSEDSTREAGASVSIVPESEPKVAEPVIARSWKNGFGLWGKKNIPTQLTKVTPATSVVKMDNPTSEKDKS